MKRMICLLLSVLLIFALFPALADNGCVLGCPLCRGARDCPTCPQCYSVFQTARPAAAATPQPVKKPVQTARPQAVQTPRPTATPKPAQTACCPIQTPRPVQTAQPIVTAAPTARPISGTGDYTTLSSAAQEQKLLNLLNQDRAANGLAALPLDAELSRIARAKSCDMRDKGYFAHESPTYGNAAAMLSSFGYAFNGVGENIAHHANVEKTEAAFLSSPGHRTNMMGSQWKKVGIGICFDKNGFVYVTELFVR